MKKQKLNRMNKKNRKMIRNTAAFRRRKETQKFQRLSREEGTLSPRSLARYVGLFVGQVTEEISAKNAAKNWKIYVQAAVDHPYEFRAMMNPVKQVPKRIIRKVEP